ncbi:hypothetical protein KP509_29G045300 [Ceratopteris richardii]|uniref:CCHC-type domain-containing protein n=1 Tax=Ceratopteris richardii TaxID=49495 RepID=A0A8T2R7S6_CERRI|nr:hypothetical protein KP509_29G045300 [Ceratopteris richardii]
MTCDYCGRQGHIQQDCRTKKRESQGRCRSSHAHLTRLDQATPTASNFNDLQLFALNLTQYSSNTDSSSCSAEWLLDTGATNHMTPSRHWLDDYTLLTKQVRVYLGDNHCLQAAGKGNMQVTLPSWRTCCYSQYLSHSGIKSQPNFSLCCYFYRSAIPDPIYSSFSAYNSPNPFYYLCYALSHHHIALALSAWSYQHLHNQIHVKTEPLYGLTSKSHQH